MAKKICCNCNKEIGILTANTKLADGYVCNSCLKAAKVGAFNTAATFTCENTRMMIAQRTSTIGVFKATKKIGLYLHIDEKNHLFKIGSDIFNFSNLLEYDLIQDGETVTSSGLGTAVVGGVLLGPLGAIVGGVAGHKNKGVCNSMKIRVTLKETYTDIVYISFIETETKIKSFTYKASQDNAQACLAALANIAYQNGQVQQTPAVQSGSSPDVAPNDEPASAADELLKFKSLLDAGVLTQEEFDEQKRKLLGL